MIGSGRAYAWRLFPWGLLLIPTPGFAYPWHTAALERDKLCHTFNGVLPGWFAARSLLSVACSRDIEAGGVEFAITIMPDLGRPIAPVASSRRMPRRQGRNC
jgi:hypothetical protein